MNSKESSFNFEDSPPNPTNPPVEKSPYAASIVKGSGEDINLVKDFILKTSSLRLIYQHKDTRYLKVTPAAPTDTF